MRKKVAEVLVNRNRRIAILEDIRKELQIIGEDKLKGELVAEDDKKTSIVLKI